MIGLGLLHVFVFASVTSASAATQQQPTFSRVIISADMSLADQPSCQQLDKAVVDHARIVAKINPDDQATRLAVNRAYHRITAARGDCKRGRIERGRARYAQALEDLSGLPPALAEVKKDDDGSP
jgi:hypothetical protein